MRQRGSILILALWSLMVLSVFAVSLGGIARQKATLSSRLESAEHLYAVALCGIERVKSEVLEDLPEDVDAGSDGWGDRPFYREIAAGGGSFTVGYAVPGSGGTDFRYGAEDEERKINLNKAEPAVILRLLQIVSGLGPDQAEDLMQCIVDWRDNDSNFQHPQYGAEDDYYDDLPLPYACKDAPLESLDELLLIKGMNHDIFGKIKPFVTVWGSGAVNINTAYPQTLEALGLDERAVEKIVMFRAGEDEKDGTGDDVVFLQAQGVVPSMDRAVPPLDPGERDAITDLIAADKLVTISSFFMARSVSKSSGRAFLEIEAVMDRTGRTYYLRSSGVQWPARGSV